MIAKMYALRQVVLVVFGLMMLTSSCREEKPLSMFFLVDAEYVDPHSDIYRHRYFISNGFELTNEEMSYVDKLRDSLIFAIGEKMKSYRNVAVVKNVQAVSYPCQSFEQARTRSSTIEHRLKEDRGLENVETIYIHSPY